MAEWSLTLISQIQVGNTVALVPGSNLAMDTNLYDIANEPAMYTMYTQYNVCTTHYSPYQQIINCENVVK